MSISVTPPFTLTEEEHSLLPSDSDVEFYAEHGWYLSKKLFTDDEIDGLLAATMRYYAGERDRSLCEPLAYASGGDMFAKIVGFLKTNRTPERQLGSRV